MTVKLITDIFPEPLLNEIKEFTKTCVYSRSHESVTLKDSDIREKCSFIQEISYDICIHYNMYNYRIPFTSNESYSVYNAFRYYMKSEFDGYELLRFNTNRIQTIKDYPDNKMTTPHYDSPDYEGDFKTVLFYVNTSDGDTLVFNEHGNSDMWDINSVNNLSNLKLTLERKQTPIENCALIYPSSKIHCARPPKINNERIVFNFVLKKI